MKIGNTEFIVSFKGGKSQSWLEVIVETILFVLFTMLLSAFADYCEISIYEAMAAIAYVIAFGRVISFKQRDRREG